MSWSYSPNEPLEHPYDLTVADVLSYFDVNEEKGLTTEQVKDSQAEPNKLDEPEKKSLLALVIEQFEDTLVRILLASAMVSFALTFFDEESQKEGWTAYVEPVVILTILILNAIVGVWQESNAEKALDALKKLVPDKAFVVRDGHWQDIFAVELVPGDIVQVKVGDKIPADLRMIKLKTTTILMEQSQLTGESQSVPKETEAIRRTDDIVIQSKINMLFSSTTVSTGSCLGVVVATGMKTEIGKIQAAVQEAAEEEEQTPLQKKLDEFGKMLANLIGVICAIVWAINYKHFFDPVHGSVIRGCIYYFKIAVALAVAAIPEGLPAVITTCLALGTRQMAKRKAIVRKLPSVETLGCTSVICSDKTGTLTTNEMCVVKLAVCDERRRQMKEYKVDGTSYTPVGKVEGLNIDWSSDEFFSMFCKIGSMCNEAQLFVDDDGEFKRKGEPTEAAIRVLVEKLGCSDSDFNERCLQKRRRDKADAQVFSDYWKSRFHQLAVLEFNRQRKSMSVLWKDLDSNSNILFVKGAPEMLVTRCSRVLLTDGQTAPMTEWSAEIDQEIKTMARGALRTIGLAFLDSQGLQKYNLDDYDGSDSHAGHELLKDSSKFEDIESGMTFVGMVGILDPPRPECRKAIADCSDAGISVILITGDNKLTAEAIATKLGILKPGEGERKNSLTGMEFEQLPDGVPQDGRSKEYVLWQVVEKKGREGAVFSRTEPKHKQQIVKILKRLGEIVAMTGDGVNDAPALKQADIGIAMGITGTEVAKEASDMVLADDNFASIVAAVEEGRSIYNNMKAFIRYMISSNVGEVASIFFTAALGIPEGLAPVQLLWVNLVTDGPPATALGFNPPDLDVMIKPPRNKNDPLISVWSYVRYGVVGFYVGCAVVGIFIWFYCFDTPQWGGDGHTTIPYHMLLDWGNCEKTWGTDPPPVWPPKPFENMSFDKEPCSYFTHGKVKASTLSLTVLVVIEMLNAFNALSEDGSLVQMPPWANPYLIIAASFSILVHVVILYVPVLAKIFNVCPLDQHDWLLVMAFSLPVIFIDEVLKLIGRYRTKAVLAYKKEKDE